MKTHFKIWHYGALIAILSTAACSNMETPAAASVAVSAATVSDAASANAAEYAPLEMNSAREKLSQARQAMTKKDYQAASDYSAQARVDAQLARSKAHSAKAEQAADALQADIDAMRKELARSAAQ
ncbi:DUF4398 domain-containing protein [Paludibacterium yongneupense]|uniref:DUF4398 domain-containing protein n=1 Tax=Paludibacterium yongneupense TaxID=400061 RepID=UPI0003F52B9A|nr:DUF4398 domain-containing protein [Paludibacterium yongneupense]